MTAEDVRAGLERLDFDEERLEELGLKGFMQPFSMTCKDHSPSNQVYVQQWDGTTWKPVSDWFESDRDVVWSMLEQAAGEYVKANQPWPKRERALRLGTNAVSATPGEPLLAVSNIEVVYDHVILVLKGVSLTVPQGGIVALLGANGAGKTTTLKAVSNLLRTERGEVTKGSITFRGQKVEALCPASWSGAAASRSWRAATASAISRSRRTCSPAPTPAATGPRRSATTWRWSTPTSRA